MGHKYCTFMLTDLINKYQAFDPGKQWFGWFLQACMYHRFYSPPSPLIHEGPLHNHHKWYLTPGEERGRKGEKKMVKVDLFLGVLDDTSGQDAMDNN